MVKKLLQDKTVFIFMKGDLEAITGFSGTFLILYSVIYNGKMAGTVPEFYP
jgi:hypothetical protein